ncbi:RNA-binding protein S1 [Carnobacteriaceae bacterium zg-ZUI78]|nr:RNA-binding protein S1 [Carnobacteriaceae bacterium zg-ZUI78]
MVVEVGNKLSGKVTSITKFGAFVQLENNQTGLVHISEVSDTFVNDVNDVLAVGDTVNVKVTNISPDGKISLSIKQAIEKPASEQSKPKFKKQQSENHTSFKERPSFQSRAPQKPKEVKKQDDFDALMSAFLKDSDERLLSLKRNTEGKRGGRGGRRS